MKDILDNWNQFINEEKKSTFPKDSAQARLVNLTREKRFSEKSDEQWEKILRSIRYHFPIKVEESRNRIYNSFTSSVSKKAFVRLFSNKADGEISDKSLMLVYEKVVLPILKRAIFEHPIISSVAIDGPHKPRTPDHQRSFEYALEKAKGGEWMPGFAQVGVGDNHVFVNALVTRNRESLYDILVHELAHIADYELIQNPTINQLLTNFPGGEAYKQGLFSNLLRGEFKSLAKAYKDLPDLDKKQKFDKKGGVWHNWHKRPEIKAELFDRKEFFDDQGRIKLDYLKDYISDPKNKDRHTILKYLDIDKVEDIKKVFDQIVKINNKVSRGSRIAEE